MERWSKLQVDQPRVAVRRAAAELPDEPQRRRLRLRVSGAERLAHRRTNRSARRAAIALRLRGGEGAAHVGDEVRGERRHRVAARVAQQQRALAAARQAHQLVLREHLVVRAQQVHRAHRPHL